MFIRDVGTSLLRRWYLTLLGLIITAGLGFGVLAYIPPTYEMKANVVLLPPSTSVEPGDNPYLQLGGLTTVVDVVTRTLTAQQVANKIEGTASGSAYTAEQDATTNSPIIVVEVSATSKKATAETLDLLLEQIPTQLEALQTPLDIAPEAQVTAKVLTHDTEPLTVTKTRLRFAIAAIAFGLVLTTLTVALVDGLLTRRRSRKTDLKNDGPGTSRPARRPKNARRVVESDTATIRSRRGQEQPVDEQRTDPESRSRPIPGQHDTSAPADTTEGPVSVEETMRS